MNETLKSTFEFIKGLPLIEKLFESRPKVAVLRFAGVIMDSGKKRGSICHYRYAKIIDKIFDRSDLQAVALVINSPGGAAAQSSLIASHIRRLADEKNIPIFAFVEDVAASGGYWLACAADEIYAQDTSIVGSIGVVSASFGFEDFIEKHNIHRRLHTAGKDKSFLDPFSAEKPEDLKRLAKIQTDIHDAFKDWVKERRGDKLNGMDKALFEGQFWTAGPAVEQGIIDGVGDARLIMKARYGDDVKLVDMSPDKGLQLPIPFLGKQEHTDIANEIIESLENRSVWSRYGL